MDSYIQGNKAAWEEAFDMRQPSYGRDIVERITSEPYAYFNDDTKKVLQKYDLAGKSIGQFCCNNGRELLSLVKTVKAKSGIGFDIAENMVAFANEKAQALDVPCQFIATNILEIGDQYADRFDAVLLTIGALCWFKDLKAYFARVSKCLKKGGIIIINEQHPITNMLAVEGDADYCRDYPLNCVFSYFDHEWISNSGMGYITGKEYVSKTFTDYTHPISDIIGAMCANHMVVTDMQEFPYDLSNMLGHMDYKGFPLSMIIEGRRE